MAEKATILLVDDDPFMLELLEAALDNKYELKYSESGEDCLKNVADYKPDIILLDIQMPNMDGYELCRTLKSNHETQNIWITFLSGLDSVEERLAGYDAGGDDYVIKPFVAEELFDKIEIAIRNQLERKQLKDDLTQAVNTAMTAMSSSGELGVILKFIAASYSTNTLESLAEELLKHLGQYSLSSSVQFRTNEAIQTFNSDGQYNVLEEELILGLTDQSRIFDFGSRTLFNFSTLSVLVKNMPLDDPDRYGRYKDHIALLVEGAESRMTAIKLEQELQQKQTAILRIVGKTSNALGDIESIYLKHQQASMRIMEDLMLETEQSFIHLGLDDEQEGYLLKLTQKAVDKSMSLYEEGLDIDSHLESVVKELDAVME